MKFLVSKLELPILYSTGLEQPLTKWSDILKADFSKENQYKHNFWLLLPQVGKCTHIVCEAYQHWGSDALHF